MVDFESFAPAEAELLVAACDESGRFVYRNRAWVRLLGEDEDPWSKFTDQDAGDVRKMLARAIRGEVLTNQLFLVSASTAGNTKPVLLHLLPARPSAGGFSGPGPVTLSGEILAQPDSWTASQTERHRMETLGRMTMGMAHDFNNLLSAILGHVDLMRISFSTSGDACGMSEHVGTIERAARDGASLIDKVQRYIRQEQQATHAPVDLPALVRDCISLTRPYWYNEPRRQGIDITVEQDLPDVPPVMGSAAELRDVIVNLILNAVQAMPQGGRLSFRTGLDSDRVLFSVGDTGVGMTEAVRARIFEPLFTTKGNLGNGMGLAVANGVIMEHGGSIVVDSIPGVGSKFTVLMPAVEIQEKSSAESTDRDGPRSVRVLVVDDEQMVRTVLRRLLTLRGHQVEEAASGAEGLERLEGSPFDVVITDQGMPSMSGREFARVLRERRPGLPVILLTGDTHTGPVDDTIDLVLTKPFRIEEVDAAIHQLT